MQINYRIVSQARLTNATILALFMLLLPVWFFVKVGMPHGVGSGKIVVAPFFGLFLAGCVVWSIRRNRALRTDPLALNWDAAGLTLIERGRHRTIPWRDVGSVNVAYAKDRRAAPALTIPVRDASDRGYRLLRYDAGSIDLRGQSIDNIADAIERARNGGVVAAPFAAGPSSGLIADATSDVADQRQRVQDKARLIVTLMFVGYVIALITMMFSRSAAPTKMLTDGEHYTAKLCGLVGLGVFVVGVLGNSIATARKLRLDLFAVLLSFWRIWAFLAVMAAFAAYPFAGVYEEYHWFSGPDVKREVRQFPIADTFASHRDGRHYSILIPSSATGIANLFGDALFDVGADDWAALNVRGARHCLALPVEVNGAQVRALANSTRQLPSGSIVPCTGAADQR